ncbi:MAG: hypothetical protein AB7I50_01740 [Vicinamibacterales bacterium]
MPKRLAPTKDDEAKMAYQVAYLSAKEEKPQKEIAEILAISQAAVSRLMQLARDLQYLQVTYDLAPRPDGDAIVAQLRSKLEFGRLENDLATLPTQTGRHLRKLRVFNSGNTDTSHEAIEQRQRTLGAKAARHVAERLRDAEIVAVTWGSTLGRLIEGVGHIGYPWSKPAPDADPADARHQKLILPAAAEPVVHADNSFTSSTLARQLDAIINGPLPQPRDERQLGSPTPRRLALTGVPAYVPTDLTAFLPPALSDQGDAVAKVLRTYVEYSSPAHRRIFKGDPTSPSLISKVDVLLTGAGTDVGFCHDDLLQVGGLTAPELEQLIVGDVGGVLLPRSDSTAARVASLNAMWTGLTERHLIDINERAQRTGQAGVILVSLGRRRADVVLAAVLRGFCTELVIDHDLAAALVEKLEGRSGRG